MDLAVYYNPECEIHEGYKGLSEKPIRLQMLQELFQEKNIETISARPASEHMLSLAHYRSYVSHMHRLCKKRAMGQVGDFFAGLFSKNVQYYLRPMSATYWSACFAAGAVCQAVDDVITGKHTRAFCAIRPPGHHAGLEKGEGFCYFNNVAIGAMRAITNNAGYRVAIVDFDHHHGNGTQEIIEARGRSQILLVSSHFEGCKYAKASKSTRKSRNTVAIPLPKGSTFQDIARLYTKHALPAIDTFKPHLLLLSAGFDMHGMDPLSEIKMRSEDYGSLTEMLGRLSGHYCGGKIVSVLEGGYMPTALKDSVDYHLQALKL